MPHNKPDIKPEPDPGIPLQGWPGYRTRANRSGLDPLDANAEEGHMEGLFIRNLFTLRLRTHDPFHLLLMFFFGAAPFLLLLVLLVSTFMGGSQARWQDYLYPIVFLVLFGAVAINFALSLLDMAGWIKPAGRTPPDNQGAEKR